MEYPIPTIDELLDIAATFVIVLDTKGVVRMVNKRGCEILDYTREEIEGKHWFRHFVPKDHALDRFRKYRQLAKEWCTAEFEETYILTKKGDERLMRWNIASMKDRQGNIIAMLRSGEDITEKKILQDRLATQEREKRKQTLVAVLEAQEKERLHIASELHDNVGQILTTSKLLLEGEINKSDAPETLSHAYTYLQKAINELRSISHKLNPAQLHEIGLINALKDLVKSVNNASAIKVTLHAEEIKCLEEQNPSITLSLFRIVQEQLNNILKHAEARLVRIYLHSSGNAIELEIIDDGKGFSLVGVSKGLGLKNIYNRAELYNGRVTIDTAPGQGCTVSVYIPMP